MKPVGDRAESRGAPGQTEAASAAAHLPAGWSTVAGLLLFGLVLSLVLYRLWQNIIRDGHPELVERWGLGDFRDAVYYPARAALDGVNPYDSAAYMARYPVGNIFPLYSPLTLILHLPYACLPFSVALVLYWCLNFGLLLLLASWAARIVNWPGWGPWLVIAALLLASQPGRGNHNAGQVALPLAVGAVLALRHGGTRPGWAGAALAWTTFKPTTGVPLLLLELARGHRHAVGWGTLLATLGALAGLGLLLAASSGPWGSWWTILTDNQSRLNADPTVDVAQSPIRIDAWALADRMAGGSSAPLHIVVSLLILVPAAAILWRTRRKPSPAGEAEHVILTSLAVVLCTYHQIYDGVLLVIPLALAWREAAAAPAPLRWPSRVRCLLMIFPFINVLWAQGVVRATSRFLPALVQATESWHGAWWAVNCSLNSLALCGAFALSIWLTSRPRCRPLPAGPTAVSAELG